MVDLINYITMVKLTKSQILASSLFYTILPKSHEVQFGAPTRTRTWTPFLKRELLYQLSYGGD